MMWWRRRQRTPIVVWVLALLGVKSLVRWRVRQAAPDWQAKRRIFGEKLDEAFQVWREPAESPSKNPSDE